MSISNRISAYYTYNHRNAIKIEPDFGNTSVQFLARTSPVGAPVGVYLRWSMSSLKIFYYV